MMMVRPDPATHSPGGKPHPQFIIDYLAAFAGAYPGKALPSVWDRGNGWIELNRRSVRRRDIMALTDDYHHAKLRREER